MSPETKNDWEGKSLSLSSINDEEGREEERKDRKSMEEDKAVIGP